jgi:dTDP-4-amino-4,6-dideoxygalactose transaminase
MDYPFQAEDGRELAPIQQKLARSLCYILWLPHWSFTNCCTDSLQMAVKLLTNVGDRVIVPAYGWRAFSNAPTIMGREVDFCDIDATGNVDLNELETMIKKKLQLL